MMEPRRYRVAASIVVCDPDGRILFIGEADPRVRGKINLPGGHLENGETVVECAVRELTKETGLTAMPSGLIGVYWQGDGICFVFCGHSDVTITEPGKDILNCEWLTLEEAIALSDSDVIRPKKLRMIMADIQSGRSYSNDLMRNMELEEWEKTAGEQDAPADADKLRT
jgi:8-oxo-dGTP pyrophosphatase MutT (NUDIX family)